MMKKLGTTLLCIIPLFAATKAFSITAAVFSQGTSVEYELKPNDPLILSNIFFFTINATCTVMTDGAENAVAITAIRKSGIVNNISLSTGESVVLNFKDNENFKVSAVSGAKVQFVNKGEKTMKAICSAA